MNSLKIIHSQENERGVALITTLLFLTVMALLSTTLVFTVQNEMQSSSAYKYNQQAFYVADAGVQKALLWYRNSYTPLIAATGANNYDRSQCPVEYNNDPVMLAGRDGSASAFPDSGVIESFLGELRNKTLSADEKNTGVYAVNSTLVKYQPAVFIDPDTFAKYPSAIERWVIDSTGYWGNINNPLGIVRIEAVIENNGNSIFDRGLWGIDGLDLGGMVRVDSFDPEIGPWDPVLNNGNAGSIGSNGSITVNGDIFVNGDVGYGPAGSFECIGEATVTGGEFQLPEERSFLPIPEFEVGSGRTNINRSPAAPLEPGVYGSYSVGGEAILELNEGTYYFDSLETAGSAKIQANGPVEIFVKNSLSLTGGGIIYPEDSTNPPDITFWYSGTDAAKFTGGSSAYLQVYAPNAEVQVAGETEYHGSFIGKTLTVGGGAMVHFNEDNEKKNLVHRPFRVLSWSQKSF